MKEELKVGDRVVVNNPESWTHGREATVVRLNVGSSDGIWGHLLHFGDGMSVVPPYRLSLVGEGVSGELGR